MPQPADYHVYDRVEHVLDSIVRAARQADNWDGTRMHDYIDKTGEKL
jgi:hypothetical protein